MHSNWLLEKPVQLFQPELVPIFGSGNKFLFRYRYLKPAPLEPSPHLGFDRPVGRVTFKLYI